MAMPLVELVVDAMLEVPDVVAADEPVLRGEPVACCGILRAQGRCYLALVEVVVVLAARGCVVWYGKVDEVMTVSVYSLSRVWEEVKTSRFREGRSWMCKRECCR